MGRASRLECGRQQGSQATRPAAALPPEDGSRASDELAVKTAVTKAAIAGFRQGNAALAFDAREQGVDLVPHVSGAEDVDPWAER